MGNVLYEAIIALGRSIEQIDRDGWMPGSLGGRESLPRCVVGHVSYALTYPDGGTFFPADYAKSGDPWLRHVSSDVFPVIGRALIDALTEKQRARLKQLTAHEEAGPYIQSALVYGSKSVTPLQCAIVNFNDCCLRDEVDGTAIVRRWLSDALDLLAEALPVPSAPIYAREQTEATPIVA
jgi:hypothetical protein